MSTPLKETTSIWALIGMPFFTSVPTTAQSTLQQRQLVLVQAQHVLPAVQVADERREAHGLRDEGRQRGAGDAEARNRARGRR